MKFKLPGGEVAGAYRNGETWRIEATANGTVDVQDAEIAETLAALAADPDHPVEAVGGK